MKTFSLYHRTQFGSRAFLEEGNARQIINALTGRCRYQCKSYDLVEDGVTVLENVPGKEIVGYLMEKLEDS